MTITAATNAFGLSLWRTMPGGNMVISPASIATTLAMAWTGARGETAKQMAGVLHLEGDPDRVAGQWGALAKRLRATGPLTLRIANRLYGQSGYQFDATFCARLANQFEAPMETADFLANAELARGTINRWVEAETDKKIANLLPVGSLDPNTRLVLVNAIYFVGKWSFPFQTHQTHARPFWVSAQQSKNVPMMHRAGSYRIATIDGGRIVELPYRGNTTAMYIARPDARDGLPALEGRLSSGTLSRALGELSHQQAELGLPRFVVDPSAAKLNELLGGLGMNLPFDAAHADFTGMANPGKFADELYLSAVFHKAFVNTDEEGTIAAAATAAAMALRGGPPRPPEPFIIDRPFLFFIVDVHSGLVLFIGRIVEP